MAKFKIELTGSAKDNEAAKQHAREFVAFMKREHNVEAAIFYAGDGETPTDIFPGEILTESNTRGSGPESSVGKPGGIHAGTPAEKEAPRAPAIFREEAGAVPVTVPSPAPAAPAGSSIPPVVTEPVKPAVTPTPAPPEAHKPGPAAPVPASGEMPEAEAKKSADPEAKKDTAPIDAGGEDAGKKAVIPDTK